MRVLAIVALVCVLAPAAAHGEQVESCLRGADAYAAGKPDVAVRQYTRCITQGALTPENLAAAHYNRGLAYYDRQAYDQAIRDFNQAIRLDPDDGEAHNNRGNAFQRKGIFARAIADYDIAIRINPDDGLAHYNRGSAYLEQGNEGQAVRDYNEAIRLSPALARTHRNYTEGLVAKLSLPSLPKLSLNLDFLDGSSPAERHYDDGNEHLGAGRNEAAVVAFTDAIRLDPELAGAYNARAWTLYLMGRDEEALADAERAVALAPGRANHLGTQGHVLAALGRPSEALAAFERGMLVAGPEWVAMYQKALARHGYYDGDAGGDYDPATRTALESCLAAGCRVVR